MTFDHAVRAPERRERELWFAVAGSKVVTVTGGDAGGATGFPGAPVQSAATDPHYLGGLDGVHCFAYAVDAELALPAGHAVSDLRSLWSTVSEQLWAVAGKAVQIVDWDRSHRFCGRCGATTERVDADRSRRCPACSLSAYPRLAPAVIAWWSAATSCCWPTGRASRRRSTAPWPASSSRANRWRAPSCANPRGGRHRGRERALLRLAAVAVPPLADDRLPRDLERAVRS